ncbi:ArsR/SmtB family transcription factor [Pontiella sp.]|uniref:ArsR/SmtB family transcription factor n=1 Tax=Pontiella sp. TaxID=2837462 RepID=UPI003567DFAD
MTTKPTDCALDKMAPEFVEQAAEMLKLLAHPVRLRIVDALNSLGDMPVGTLTERLGIAQAATSKHLNQMRRVGLLKAQRRGKEVWYSLADDRPIALLNCLCNCCDRNG